MKTTATRTALTLAALLLGAVLSCVSVARGASAAASPATDSPMGGMIFDSIHLGLNAKPPAQCTVPLYGTVTAKSPDGAMCLCHQRYDGKQGFWEQIGTGRPCWPDIK